ncbi:hypothetical protein [Nonomuraea sp. bgisy101]|uniref:hypothetical protein n=1 Tax=Nonomuraea sp. bgisy101 TaxID=3413784 RepID=UPI003D72AAE7
MAGHDSLLSGWGCEKDGSGWVSTDASPAADDRRGRHRAATRRQWCRTAWSLEPVEPESTSKKGPHFHVVKDELIDGPVFQTDKATRLPLPPLLAIRHCPACPSW